MLKLYYSMLYTDIYGGKVASKQHVFGKDGWMDGGQEAAESS